MGAVSNARRLRWQRDAHRMLGEFLATATRIDLPAMSWTIPISGALVGDVDSLLSTPAEMRASFDGWARQLGAKVAPERVDSDGVAHLYAQFKVSDDGFDGGGAIRAKIYPPMDDEAGA